MAFVLVTVVKTALPPVMETELAFWVAIVPSPRFVRIVAGVPSERLLATLNHVEEASVAESPNPKSLLAAAELLKEKDTLLPVAAETEISVEEATEVTAEVKHELVATNPFVVSERQPEEPNAGKY